MFGFRYWHEDDRAALADDVWDAMKRAIDQQILQAQQANQVLRR